MELGFFSKAGVLLLMLWLTSVEPLPSSAKGKGRHYIPSGLREMAERVAASSLTRQPPFQQSFTHVPKYMLELYKTMAEGKGRRKGKESDIIRSYGNVNGDLYKKYDDIINTREQQKGGKTRIHTLVFNIMPLPQNERLQMAELRLFTLIQRDQNKFLGVERKVTISLCHSSETGYSCDLIESRHICERVNNWKKFNATTAVEQWLNNSHIEQRLEIRIDSIFRSVDEGDLDIPVEPYLDTEPLLLVYSTDTHFHENQHALYRRSADLEDAEEDNNVIQETVVVKVPSHSKAGRKKQRNHCRRKNMWVNFADINYDNWIIAPTGFEAGECIGKCYSPSE